MPIKKKFPLFLILSLPMCAQALNVDLWNASTKGDAGVTGFSLKQ